MQNKNSDVIIIGAGAAGLIAAREISKKRQVTILEARNRLGGRIFTAAPEGFSLPLELGAEFIHGELPITDRLLKEAHIASYTVEGETFQIRNGTINKSETVIEGLDVLASKVKYLNNDIPFKEFLEKYLSGDKYKRVRESAKRFVEGYDAADIGKASTLALSKEWEGEGVISPKRIEGGYGKIVEFLAEQIRDLGCTIHLSAIAKEIKWGNYKAEILTENGKYIGDKVLVTVPAGVLKSNEEGKGSIKFTPSLPSITEAVKLIGYGSVIKVFYEFYEAFWESSMQNLRKIGNPGFIITDMEFTAWWSQLPKKIPLLTGWLAGSQLEEMSTLDKNDFLKKGIDVLCGIFNAERPYIEKKLKAKFIADWKTDPFSLGAYSYATVDTPKAKKIMNEPIEETIYFAGEALSESESMGTVEAAFESGLHAAETILA